MNSKKLATIRALQLKEYFKISAIYLLVYFVIMAILMAYVNYGGGTLFYDISLGTNTFSIVTKVFLLVLGVVNFTVTFADFLVQGATRREYLVGTLSAIIILALSFTLLLTAIYLGTLYMNGQPIDVGNTVLLMAASWLLYYAYFIIGWFIGMCFVKYRVIGGIFSIIISGVCIVLMEISTSIGFASLINNLEITNPMSIPLAYNLLGTIIISFLITYYVYAKTKKIYFKL